MSFFDRHAGEWDALRDEMFGDAVGEAALARARLHADAVVVDMGAGTGFLSQALAPKVALVHAVDRSAAMLAVARDNLLAFDNVEFHLADGATVPLPDGAADAVLANMYLHHTVDPPGALAEMVRVLRPGGRLVITDLDRHDHEWLRSEQDDVWLGFERDALERWFLGAGLREVRIENTAETCCASSCEGERARISVFVASGTR